MAFSTYCVYEAIKRLTENGARKLTYSEIALEVGCHPRTVMRAVHQLSEQEKILVTGKGRKASYRFEVCA